MLLSIAIIFWISTFDILGRKIHNVSLLLLLFALLAFHHDQLLHLSFSNSLWSVVIGLVLHKIGVIAGGDIKLLAILSLFIDKQYFVLTILIMLISGGIVAIICWLLNMWKNSPEPPSVPYAVPICIAGLFGLLASS